MTEVLAIDSLDTQASIAAKAITEASPPIFPVVGLTDDFHLYPFSNDSGLYKAYSDAYEKRATTDLLVSKDDSVCYATLIVGNGSFESATTIIPEDDIIIFCDANPFTLFMQRVVIEAMRGNETLADFSKSLKFNLESLGGYQELELLRQVIGDSQAQSWKFRDRSLYEGVFLSEVFGREKLWTTRTAELSDQCQFFTHNQLAYSYARGAVLKRDFAFYLIDLASSSEVERFGEVLENSNVLLAQANVTNVFSFMYAGGGESAVQSHLPWQSEDVPVIYSRSLRSRVTTLRRLGGLSADTPYL